VVPAAAARADTQVVLALAVLAATAHREKETPVELVHLELLAPSFRAVAAAVQAEPVQLALELPQVLTAELTRQVQFRDQASTTPVAVAAAQRPQEVPLLAEEVMAEEALSAQTARRIAAAEEVAVAILASQAATAAPALSSCPFLRPIARHSRPA
jgi:hypothetical protein